MPELIIVNPLRNISSFILTALILVNLFGFYTIFLFKQADIKQEMAENISNAISTERSEVLSFEKDAYSKLLFTDNGKEFRFNGKLFDVVSIKNAGNNFEITVEYDSKETALIEGFRNMLGQQQDKDQNSSPIKNIISHFQQDCVVRTEHKYVLNNTVLMQYCMVNRCFPSLLFSADKPTPPPQFFLV